MIFQLDDASFSQNGRRILSNLSFAVAPGERLVLLGVNGCGKSTLLKLLDGLHFATGGAVRFEGRTLDPAAMEDPGFRRRFRKEVALLFQNVDAMLFNPTVADEIAFGPRQFRLDDVEGRVARWADAFGVSGLLDRAPFELSGGEKKRVALAALMAVEPSVLLLDEPNAGLDPASAARLVDLLAERRELTVISSTHNLTLADELGTRALLLAPDRPGTLFDGPPEKLLGDERLLIESGLAHRHVHGHHGARHVHYHLHDAD